MDAIIDTSSVRCFACSSKAGWVAYTGKPDDPNVVVRASCARHDKKVWYYFTMDRVGREPDWIVKHLRESKRRGVAERFISWVEKEFGTDYGLSEMLVDHPYSVKWSRRAVTERAAEAAEKARIG